MKIRPLDISPEIRLLTSTGDVNRLDKILAFFDFVAYMRWPKDEIVTFMGSRLYYARFIGNEIEDASLSPIRAMELLKRIDLSELIALILTDKIFDFNMDISSGNEDSRHIATVVRFLISYDPGTDDRRQAASIKKAHFAIDRKYCYGMTRGLSWKRFCQLWDLYKSVCFFHYVNEFHFKRKMLIDPTDPEFHSRVTAIIEDQRGLTLFFQQARWVKEKVQHTLDPRAFRRVPLAKFPGDLPSVPVAARSDFRVRDVLRDYRANAQ